MYVVAVMAEQQTGAQSVAVSLAIASAFQMLHTTYSMLKEEQEEVVAAILEGRDVFAQLPTGLERRLFWRFCRQLLIVFERNHFEAP